MKHDEQRTRYVSEIKAAIDKLSLQSLHRLRTIALTMAQMDKQKD